MAEKTMMPAGTYYIGDLCYVMDGEWNEFCQLTIKDNTCLQGKFTLADGREFASFSTRYGDGEYRASNGAKLGVDAGLIGCIKVEDITDDVDKNYPQGLGELGTVVTFDKPFSVSGNRDTGRIRFGHITIRT
jgi:hypothetical protein